MTVKVLHKLREEIKAKIDVADENILKQIDSILIPKKNKNDIVAYSMKGEAITRKELEDELLLAEQEIKDGNYITLEEFENEIKKW